MNKPYPVGPGWWPLLDTRLPEIKALAPEADIHVKEKYGLCRVLFFYLTEDKESLDKAHTIAREIEAASAQICEVCGGTGEVSDVGGWLTCLCSRCAALSQEERSRAEAEEVEKYHRRQTAKSLFGILPSDAD